MGVVPAPSVPFCPFRRSALFALSSRSSSSRLFSSCHKVRTQCRRKGWESKHTSSFPLNSLDPFSPLSRSSSFRRFSSCGGVGIIVRRGEWESRYVSTFSLTLASLSIFWLPTSLSFASGLTPFRISPFCCEVRMTSHQKYGP